MIRYQSQYITIPAGSGSVSETILEMYRDMPSLTGIAVTTLGDPAREVASLAFADRVKDLADPVPVHFYKTPYTYWLPVHTEAAGNNLTIRKISDNVQRDITLMVTLQLSDEKVKPAKPFRFFHKRLQPGQIEAGSIYRSELVNLPTEFKYVSGMWVSVREAKGGTPSGVLKPVDLMLSAHDITGMPKLDFVPVDLLYRDGAGYNHNRRFYPVNFNGGGSIYFELKTQGGLPETIIDIVLLMSDHKLKL
jgi:hypothetical protein